MVRGSKGAEGGESVRKWEEGLDWDICPGAPELLVTPLVGGWLQKLEVVDAGIGSVQTDVRRLTEERDNIRSTFDDLTVKVIHLQVIYTHAGRPDRQSHPNGI